MANFFIDRPIFAWVLAILLCLTGVLAITSLPVEQYPDLAPPNVRVTANYPGASAQTLENTVTNPTAARPETAPPDFSSTPENQRVFKIPFTTS